MTVQPGTVEEIQALVRAHDRIRVRGSGTKSCAETGDGVTIDLRRLSGITDYTADECVFTARAGTPLLEIERTLRAHGHYLPFDPPLAAAGATIGGTVAAGLSGSGRYQYGGVRDFIIGARVVDGEGRVIRSGGKVVKNAAGFLLHHGLVGSLGRFGILTELTFKVFPLPETRATCKVECGSVEHAAERARILERRRFDLAALDFDGNGTMWIRIAGRAEALPARISNLQNAMAVDAECLEGERDEEVWSSAREWGSDAHTSGSGRASCIKVPDLLKHWHQLSHSVQHVRHMCGGSFACVTFDDLAPLTSPPTIHDLTPLSSTLASVGLPGVVVRGRHAGMHVGVVEHNQFEERVRHVLDPRNRFSAASHPTQ